MSSACATGDACASYDDNGDNRAASSLVAREKWYAPLRVIEPEPIRVPEPTPLDPGRSPEPRDVQDVDQLVMSSSYLVGSGDASDLSDSSQDVNLCDDCPQTDDTTVFIAWEEQARALGDRVKIRRSYIYDLGLDALLRRVDPRSMPHVLEALSTLVSRARAAELASSGLEVAVRALFFRRGSAAFEEVPHGEYVLNQVKEAAAKMPDALVLVFGMASSESGDATLNTLLADRRAITVVSELKRVLGNGTEVLGVGIYPMQRAGFALDTAQVEQYFGLALLPRRPHGVLDTRDAVSNQGVMVVVVSRKGKFFVLLDAIGIDRAACA